MHCELCGKTTGFGRKVAHDRMYINGKTSRKVKPNLQTMHLPSEGGMRRVTACTRCMRTIRKHNA